MKTISILYQGLLTSKIPYLVMLLLVTISVQASITVTNTIPASDGCNGSIEITIAADAGYELAEPFTFEDNGVQVVPEIIEQLDNFFVFTLNNLCEGSHDLTITNIYGCSKHIIEHLDCTFSLTADLSPACDGTTGSIALGEHVGAGNANYLWSDTNGNPVGNNSPILENVPAGEYCVWVRNEAGCEAEECFTLEEVPFSVEFEVDVASGSIRPTLTGGTAPFSFHWEGPEGFTTNTSYLEDAEPGVYIVKITDNNGCLVTSQVELCKVLDFEVTSIEPACPEQATGSLCIVPNIEGAVVQWADNSALGDCLEDITSGTYTVKVFDNICNQTLIRDIDLYPSYATLDVVVTENHPSGPIAHDGSIILEPSSGTPPYTYLWDDLGTSSSSISSLAVGTYCCQVMDAACQEATICIELIENCSPVLIGIQHHGLIDCSGGTGMLTATPFQEEEVMTYEWSNGENTQTIENLLSGEYCVTVTNSSGCSEELCFELYEPESIDIAFEKEHSRCGEMSGSITLEVTGGTPDYTYLWADGVTTKDRTNLGEGWHDVTVTDANGCSSFMRIGIREGILLLEDAMLENSTCATACNGSISLDVNATDEVTYQWSNGATTSSVEGLCTGKYEVTISSANCTLVESYTIDGDVAFDYEVEVLQYFENSVLTNGAAQVEITSDIFPSIVGANVHLVGTELTSFVSSTGIVRFYLPAEPEFQEQEVFYFTIKTDDGCIYDGSFPGIHTCEDAPSLGGPQSDNPDVFFDYQYIGNPDEFCGTAEGHTYEVIINGPNSPYSIEVNLIQAFNTDDNDYFYKEEFENGTHLVTGIPDGRIEFLITDKCGNSYVGNPSPLFYDVTCCFESELFGMVGEPSFVQDKHWRYTFNYFTLFTENNCFSDDSQIKIDVPDGVLADLNCWGGTVTITYPNPDETFVFKVTNAEDGEPYDQIEVLSGQHTWQPDVEGVYFVDIHYEGTGPYDGDDHFIEDVELEWLGVTNYADAIGFDNELWFNNPFVEDIYDDAYFGAWRCRNCSGTPIYIYDQDDCDDFDNWEFVYFDFVPNNYDDPCSSGGTITIMKFDENGNAYVDENIQVPAEEDVSGNLVKGEKYGIQPFGTEQNEWCTPSGWCLFDALYIYGFELDEPLLATWYQGPCETIIWDDPEEPNPSPCDPDEDDPNSETGCPLGTMCADDGNCYPICEEGECPSGFICEDGLCLPDPDADCIPACPDEYECYEGECYLEESFCGFYREVNGTGSNSFRFYHGDLSGMDILFEYKTLYIEDKITLSGAKNLIIDYVSTEHEYFSETYRIDSELPYTTVTVEPKPGSSSSRYSLRISCVQGGEALSSDINTNTNEDADIYLNDHHEKTEEAILNIQTIYPNPFNNQLNLNLSSPQAQALQVTLYDLLGQPVFRAQRKVQAGKNTLHLDLPMSLVDGIYFLEVRDEQGQTDGRKVVHAHRVKTTED